MYITSQKVKAKPRGANNLLSTAVTVATVVTVAQFGHNRILMSTNLLPNFWSKSSRVKKVLMPSG